ncbi:MAG: hypothetical protein RLZZ573_560 [Pseudomonadota bacterium]
MPTFTSWFRFKNNPFFLLLLAVVLAACAPTTYPLAGNSLTVTDSVSAQQLTMTQDGGVTLLPNGMVLVTGGYENPNALSTSELYN